MVELREAVDIVAAVLYIVGVMRLRTPATARSGNLIAAVGMVLVLAVTWIGQPASNLLLIVIVAAAGAAVGIWAGRGVAVTAMPQMVALLNGMGGGAAALVALEQVLAATAGGAGAPVGLSLPAVFTVLCGAFSLGGSAIAFLKLQELMTGRPITFGGQHVVNALVLLVLAVAGVWAIALGTGAADGLVVAVAVGGALLGVLVVLPVGGADMPVIISLLNALTGLAVAISGFVLSSAVLIVAGALVGASGFILTQLMAKAMHRSIGNVLFAGFGGGSQGAAAGSAAEGTVHPTQADEVAMMLAYAQLVVIVPGSGLAVARAQQEVRELMDLLVARGVDVRFAIHPVAGRMPGHMNVILAEANVPYDRLYEMERINSDFPRADVALVIGANDVTNPAARNDPGSPIYGMPILDVDKAHTVVVCKRSMASGFAGVDNPLFTMDKTLMLFGDARATVLALIGQLKEMAA